MKKFSEWTGDLEEYLIVGDIVDEELVEYFINTMPPAAHTSTLIQIGEPNDHVNGKAVYPTLKLTSKGWIYAGNCYRGNNINMAITIKEIGADYWGRKVYKNVRTKKLYKDVDGKLYTSTEFGEPDCPLRKDLKITII